MEEEELQQPIVQDKAQQVFAPKLVEEEELQQPLSNGEKLCVGLVVQARC
jgi:hypothetical protein